MRDSIWLRTLDAADRAVLEASDSLPDSADVVVAGAGLIGLATAYYLVELGVENVCVVEQGDLLGEASGANAGGLWFAHQASVSGEAASGLLAESAAMFDELEDLFAFDRTSGGVLQLIESEGELAAAEQSAAAVRALGFEAEVLNPEEMRDVEPNLRGEFRGGLLWPDDGHVHPAKLAAGLIRRIRDGGGRICTGAKVTQAGPPAATSAGNVDAQCVVVACGAWTPLLTQTLGWAPPIRPARGTLLALPELPAGTLRTTILGPQYYWWQLSSGAVVGGGSEEMVGFERALDKAVIRDIRADLAQRLPALAEQPTVVSWAGFRPHCADLLPVIGGIPGREDVFVSAGHFRMGVMTAPASGLALAQLIVDGETDVDLSAMDPERFALSAA